MSPEMLKQQQQQLQARANDDGSALPIDTSSMSQGQAEALEVAESARDAQDRTAGFAGGLFLGSFQPHMLHPFPEQNAEDRVAGNALVSKVSTFLNKHLDADAVDETRTIPREVVEGLRDLGVFRMKVPPEYGGMGLSQVNYNRVLLAIASHCGSTAVLVSAHQSIGVPQPLKMFGTPEQKAKYLPRISEGQLSAFALTEPEVGSDPARMTTTATLSDDGVHYVLNGMKQWATNGPIADLMVVMAQTAPKVKRGREKRQITAFIVENDWPGVEMVHRCDFMGLRGIHNGIIKFNNVKVPAENVLWGEGLGLKLALRTLNTGRLTLPAACTGLAKQCLAMARQWGRTRVQWGHAIGEHEAGADKIAYIASTTFAMDAVTWLTSHWADQQRDIRIEAAMAKLFCSEAAWKIVDLTMQLRGGRGYERAQSLRERGETPWPVERMMRDCRINTIIEGTTDIMRLFLAREALDPHLQRSMDLLRPGVPLGRKLSTGFRVAGHYALWYPAQMAGRLWSSRTGGNDQLSRHERYIARASHRLAARLFGAMARHQQKLERQQVLLGRLMDIGTELFAMSAACAYARSLVKQGSQSESSFALADEFCRQARTRIDEWFRIPRPSRQARTNALARGVMDDKHEWLEQGVIEGDRLKDHD